MQVRHHNKQLGRGGKLIVAMQPAGQERRRCNRWDWSRRRENDTCSGGGLHSAVGRRRRGVRLLVVSARRRLRGKKWAAATGWGCTPAVALHVRR